MMQQYIILSCVIVIPNDMVSESHHGSEESQLRRQKEVTPYIYTYLPFISSSNTCVYYKSK